MEFDFALLRVFVFKLVRFLICFFISVCFFNLKVKALKREVDKRFNLTDVELDYFNRELGSGFRVLGQSGGFCQDSAFYRIGCFGCENGFVLKVPNSCREVRSKWMEEQNKQKVVLERLFRNCSLNVKLPNVIKLSENYLVEEYLGENLDFQVYVNLTDIEKNKIARDVAAFLSFLHEICSDVSKKTIKFSEQLAKFNVNSLDDMLKFINILPNEGYDFLLKLKTSFKSEVENLINNDFEVACVLTQWHNDLFIFVEIF